MVRSILRLPAVIERTGLGRSNIYLKMSLGAFPRSISLGDRAVGWLEEDINRWVESRIEASSKKLGKRT